MYVVFDKNTSQGSVESVLGSRGMSCPLSRQHKKSLVTSAWIWFITKQSLVQEQAHDN